MCRERELKGGRADRFQSVAMHGARTFYPAKIPVWQDIYQQCPCVGKGEKFAGAGASRGGWNVGDSLNRSSGHLIYDVAHMPIGTGLTKVFSDHKLNGVVPYFSTMEF